MKRLELLDYGRFVAAVCVMGYHYLFNGVQNGKITTLTHVDGLVDAAKYGYLGVEFFFVISGYVIFFSAQGRSAAKFAVSRAVRLYPAFWCAMLTTALVASSWGGGDMAVSASQVVANVTMFPELVGYGFVDGVYWTLQLELSFYAAVLVVLLVGLQRSLATIALAWPAAMLIAKALGAGQLPYLGGYYAYFAAGMLFALIKRGRHPFAWAGLAACLYLCIDFSTGRSLAFVEKKGVDYSLPVIATLIALQFAFFLVLNTRRGSDLQLPASRLAGGLTYPIYLLHAHIGYMALSRFGSDEHKIVSYLAVAAAVFALAYAIHVVVEQRLAPVWKRLFEVCLGRPLELLTPRARAGTSESR